MYTGGLEDKELLPVMFFVYGGGYEYGTQLKMDQARLGEVADIVLVAVNYRVGPLGMDISQFQFHAPMVMYFFLYIGYMCLDSEYSGGTMGMMHMVLGLE